MTTLRCLWSKESHAVIAICTSSRVFARANRSASALQALGRKDHLIASGALDRLLASIGRHTERSVILSDMAAGTLACTRIRGPLLFGRLWERLGIAAVLRECLSSRAFEFDVERAVFVSVLHRLFVSGSVRACEKWLADYQIPGTDDLSLHHLYRAMA